MNYAYGPAPANGFAKPLTSTISSVGSSVSGMFTSFWGVMILIFVLFVVIVIYYKNIGYYLDIGWERILRMIKGKDSVNVEIGDNGLSGDLKPMDGSDDTTDESAVPPEETGLFAWFKSFFESKEEKDRKAARGKRGPTRPPPPEQPIPEFAPPSPMDAPPVPSMPMPDIRPPGMPGAAGSADGGGILSSLQIGGPHKEVYNVSKNIYTFSDASAVCSAMGGELASYEQVKEAYEKGADWCNYGWTKGQMALYPTQKETWDKLQKGSAEYRDACGKPGVNGGYFDNPDLRFGVNCYGVKPPRNATDELLESSVALPPSAEEIEYEKKVQKFREQLSTTTVLPFRRGQWTE